MATYLNRQKPNPRVGQRFSIVQRGGQTMHRYGPGRLFPGGPRPRATPKPPARPKPVKPPALARPPAAPVVGGPPAPPDPRYESDLASAARQRDETVAGLGAARVQGLAGYGYNEGPGGTLTFDVNNPQSRAAQLKRNYDGQRRRTGQQLASGGQLYAGAYQGAQDVVNRGQLADEDALQKSLADFLARNTASTARARTSYEESATQAESERVGRIPENPLYEPTVGFPSPGPKKGKPKPKKKGKR